MGHNRFQYCFHKSVEMAEAEATLLVAMIAVEGLHGSSAVRMHGRYNFEPKQRMCEIDAGSAVGCDLNRIYVGFLQREFGPAAFTVQQANIPAPQLVA